jgi:lipopolysaccharide export system protein LptA
MRHRITALTCLLTLTSSVYAQNNPSGSVSNLMDSKGFDDSFGKLPTNITSDSLAFNAKDRIFAYTGNVQVTQGDMRLTSKTLEGTYSEKNELLKLVAKGDVFIAKQDIQATGQIASYDAIAAIVTLTENPQLQQKESILRADKIKIFLNENRSQAEGDVRVTFVNSKDGNPGLPSLNPVAPQPSAAPAAAVATPTPAPKATSTAAPSKKAAPAKKKATPTPTVKKKA